MDYHVFAGNNEVTLGLGARRFSFDYNEKFDKQLIYERYTPSVKINFGGNPASLYSQKAELRQIFLREQKLKFDEKGNYLGLIFENSNITELSYSGFLKNALGNTAFQLAFENQSYTAFEKPQVYSKMTLDLKHNFVYQKGKSLHTRIFLGGFLRNSQRESSNFTSQEVGNNANTTRGSLSLSSRGRNDYRFDDLWLGRGAETGLSSQQIDPNTEGGMKFTLPGGDIANITQVGFSNSFIASLNLSLDLPVNLPRFFKIKPYFDIGYLDDTSPVGQRTGTNMLASGGVQWSLFGDAFSIYIPVYFSGKPLEEDPNSFKALMSKRGGFLDRITFSLKVSELNPRKLVRLIAN